jgi:hypothetical protein
MLLNHSCLDINSFALEKPWITQLLSVNLLSKVYSSVSKSVDTSNFSQKTKRLVQN